MGDSGEEHDEADEAEARPEPAIILSSAMPIMPRSAASVNAPGSNLNRSGPSNAVAGEGAGGRGGAGAGRPPKDRCGDPAAAACWWILPGTGTRSSTATMSEMTSLPMGATGACAFARSSASCTTSSLTWFSLRCTPLTSRNLRRSCSLRCASEARAFFATRALVTAGPTDLLCRTDIAGVACWGACWAAGCVLRCARGAFLLRAGSGGRAAAAAPAGGPSVRARGGGGCNGCAASAPGNPRRAARGDRQAAEPTGGGAARTGR
ncbi:hypothetical protein DFJ74DRAFT_649504 [Hyaloraphidium curvatum]|nr:hypothetical protein DFJ74DRAFT_649504 [Hyaloraphidium curvatum]